MPSQIPDPTAPPATRMADQLAPTEAHAMRQRAEATLKQQLATSHNAQDHSTEGVLRALHELQVHQIELEMQNDELRRMQDTLETSRADYTALYDQAPVGYVTLNDSGQMLRANQTAASLLGLSCQAMLGAPLHQFIHRDDQDTYYLLRQRRQTQQKLSAELRLKRADGSFFWARLMATQAQDEAGAAQLRMVLFDISERIAAQEQLFLAASVFSQAREGIMITNTRGQIVNVNAAFTHITGYSRDEVLHQRPSMLSSGRQNATFYTAMWHDILNKGHWYGEIWNRRKNGEVYAELQTITTVRDAKGTATHYVALFSDITSFKASQTRLEHSAHYDLLTNLPNRALLADRLRQDMAQAQRHDVLLAVAYVDLDSFKAVNDEYGHETGDRLLVALSNRMKEVMREGDTLARIGGDEFVAVLTDLVDTAGCLPMLHRLLAAANQSFLIDGLTLQVSASLGVTFYPQTEAMEPDQLLRQADQAMYQAKQTGKNHYHLFDAVHDRSVRGHHEGLERIRLALASGELVLHYQPKVNMRSGLVVGAEALIRWQHPDHGLLLPLAFLPLMETDPLAIEVGEWVIATALTQITLWQAQGLELQVSVNVGAQQLQQPNFVDRLRSLLQAHPGMDPGKLTLEMLETSALQDIGYASQVIEDCQKMGVAFALDDFGTGYSSLTYLKRLRVSTIKIDQSFVRNMLDDPQDRSILEGVISLARAFNREVIAEGVETIAHGSLLLQLGCDLAQGYGIARPMPADTLPAWVSSWQPDAAWSPATAVAQAYI
ncbi:bifunctional diguanylate cyclase/phosphodiesterase [Rhodoferax sp. U11-2br]|uniref:putative bifunctional diguanylate cyclase/phosphodiesterase n=1 Tax=Rhodoferax sp. U11-2br TaxID=2838878 RepID=UPI001BE999EF|nr:EAL domain-containing protein [Rhodoferax sp. U11-2br]MBT3067470.1 EAL domain-containing protein [Rhodoferax sp. U11-2br]